MDALARLLDGPRAHGAVVLRAELDPPFAVRVEDQAPLTVVTPLRGQAWLCGFDGLEPLLLEVGSVAVVRGPAPYVVADDPATVTTAVIGPGHRSYGPDGAGLCRQLQLGPRGWGLRDGGSTTLLVGTYPVAASVSQWLLTALPARLVLHGHEWQSQWAALLADELDREAPGQDVVIDRLLDLLLVASVRAWCATVEGQAWLQRHGDPVVGPALAQMHADLAHPWSVAELASQAQVSRPTFARRFAAAVGESPMAYLTAQRLTVAAELLRQPSSTIDGVARRVGYGNGFALSAAFKRQFGVSPQSYRDRADSQALTTPRS
jgi:AraC-like DNA-binding protein